jgi:hypothetical protein
MLNFGSTLITLGVIIFVGALLYDMYNLHNLRKCLNVEYTEIQIRLNRHHKTLKAMNTGALVTCIGIFATIFALLSNYLLK